MASKKQDAVDQSQITGQMMPERDPADGYRTGLGQMRQGFAEDVLVSEANRLRKLVQMVFTSPPFALNRKKRYGNRTGDEYIEWLASFGPKLTSLLKPDGSIVVEMGNAWVHGSPTMSTLSLKALLAFQERSGLHLCQEFICYNPARLPAPAQWVTIERIRVKDAFTRVWWMSPTERPKADNRKVRTEYSQSMKTLLKRGTYNSGKRPSEYDISPKSFLINNGGAIVPNVIVPTPGADQAELFETLPIANTRADDRYQKYCREHKLEMHPARMPAKLVEFFVEFLTDPGDLVLDPFAGSNTTGAVAERMGRRWLSIEANPIYIAGSRARFDSLPDESHLLPTIASSVVKRGVEAS
jgi:DNA methylase